MTDLSQLLTTFISPMLLIMALVMMLSMVVRSGQKMVHNDILFGGIFALAVFFSMSDPIVLPSNGIFDMRGLLIGTGTALLGPRVGAFALITGLSYRWGIGNPGVAAGFTGMFIAFGAGLAWRHFVAPMKLKPWQQASSLGIVISLQVLAILVVDSQYWAQLFMSLAPYTLVCNVLGTFLIKYLVENEMKHLSMTRGLELAASTDHLTGLLNRRSLEVLFPTLSEGKGKDSGITALYFDIDRFKSINDTYGHAVGDAVLKVITTRLASTLRAQDAFSRLGGDEFVVLLPSISKSEAAIVAERCRKLIAEKPIRLNETNIYVTISIGAIWTRQESSFDTVLKLADQALYEAKAMGRNAVSFKSDHTLDGSPPLQASA